MKSTPKIFHKITRLAGKAIGEYNLVEEGDRILVALSGGKDSWTLLYALRALQQRAPIRFQLAAVTVNPGFEAAAFTRLTDHLIANGFAYNTIPADIVPVVNDNLSAGTNPCSFCSRLRRGILYTHAMRHGWNKIALGHHLDDFVETLFLNLFYNAAIKGMSPKLFADNGVVTVIRPLLYVHEAMTRDFAHEVGLPVFGCSCAYQGMSSSRRGWIKGLLRDLEKDIPNVRTNVLHAMKRVEHRHLLTPDTKVLSNE